MLLRRVIEHVKAQNWTAVALDFVIVVVGVFMGIQLGNWNEQRVFAAQERGYLEELREEIRLNNEMLTARVGVMNRVTEAGREGYAFLTDDTPCQDNCWRLAVDMFHASQVMFGPSARTVYEQMLRIDLPSSEKIKDAMANYYRLDSAMTESFDKRPPFREHVRKILPAAVQGEMWRHCYELRGVAEYLIADCPKRVDDAVTRAALEELRANQEIAKDLNHWLGMHELWVPVFNDIIARGEETIANIDEELGRE